MDCVNRKKIVNKFGLNRYSLKHEALKEVFSFLSHFPQDQDKALDDLLAKLHHQFRTCAKLQQQPRILDKELVQSVAASLLLKAQADPRRVGEEEEESSLTCISSSAALRVIDNIFVIPKFRYDQGNMVFYEHSGRISIHGDASAKAFLYRDRFLLLRQRLYRDPHFSVGSQFGSCEISPIQSLIGLTGRRWVMGVISQFEDGHFYLEDLTAAVEINLSDAITAGFFSENTIVLVEGQMLLDGVFQVKTCGFPPLEDRDKSISAFPGFDFFGCGTPTTDETLEFAEMGKRAMFVIISDIWLDDEDSMRRLKKVLCGYDEEDVVPSLFVFMGNFCSHPCNLSFNSFSSLRLQFGKFGQMIGACSQLMKQSRFLLIPGPDDPGPSTVLPRCALPKHITEEFKMHIPNAIFSSNPCRVKFCTQEIVFFRQDLLYRMRRSCLIPPSTEETSEPFEHLVATLTHQGHLCPLPLSVQPVIWNYDHCLQLYPTPHTIVVGDKSEQKSFTYKGTTCFNPGSFSSDSTFAAYRPCTSEVELSKVE